MANDPEYQQAFDAVRRGTANSHQRNLTEMAANKAGSWGQQARNAMRDAGKGNPDKWGSHKWF